MKKPMMEFYEKLKSKANQNTWFFRHGSNMDESLKALKELGKDVTIWGASNGGLKVLDILSKYSVSVKQFVDSDSNKWGRKVADLSVKNPNELTRDDFVVIGSVYENEIANSLKAKGVSYTGGILCLYEFNISDRELEKKGDELFEVYKLLEDEDSRETFFSTLLYAIDGDGSNIKVSDYKQYFHPLVKPMENDVIVDGGAYTGDTVEKIIEYIGEDCKIYAFEPDRVNYLGLERNMENRENVIPIDAGLWRENAALKFKGTATMGSSVAENGKGNYSIRTVSLDSFFKGREDTPTLIKMDIEGAELEALKGAKGIITKYKPKLQICLYHKTSHIFEIPLMLKRWVPDYRLFFGHHSGCWNESVLYCL